MAILVVEDDAVNRTLLERWLARRGYGVKSAVDGYDALVAAAAERPALVLIDLLMPRMTGLEFVRRLRAMTDGARIPVIAISSDERLREGALAVGCTAFLRKPVDFPALLAMIENLGLEPSRG